MSLISKLVSMQIFLWFWFVVPDLWASKVPAALDVSCEIFRNQVLNTWYFLKQRRSLTYFYGYLKYMMNLSQKYILENVSYLPSLKIIARNHIFGKFGPISSASFSWWHQDHKFFMVDIESRPSWLQDNNKISLWCWWHQ